MHFLNFKTLTSVCLLSVLLFAGCKKHEPDEPEQLFPKLTLESETLDVSAKGGVLKMKYTLENSVKGEKLSLQCAQEWVSEFDVNTPGVISFKVAANGETVAREAEITVTYASLKPIVFKVKQSAGELPDPEIKFENEWVNVPAEGASCDVPYEIINPVDGANVTVRCDAPWVTDFDLSTAGKISFKVAKSLSRKARETIVFIDYAGHNTLAYFRIGQEAPEVPFDITVSDVASTSFKVNVVPKDNEMNYLLSVVPEKITQGFIDEDLYNYDINSFKDMASGSDWISVAQEHLEKGEINGKLVENMEPETSYLIYAYGVDPNTIERQTPISIIEVTTTSESSSGGDEAKFEITLSSVEGLDVDINVKADSYGDYFVAKILSNVYEDDTEDDIRERIIQLWDSDVLDLEYSGYTTDMILYELANSDPTVNIQETLNPNSAYYVYAFAVDENAKCCSEITLLKLVTNETTVVQ